MYKCPVCEQLTISTWAKIRPGIVTCKNCGGRLRRHRMVSGTVSALFFLGLIGTGWLSLKYWSWIPLIGLVVGWVASEAVLSIAIPLVRR